MMINQMKINQLKWAVRPLALVAVATLASSLSAQGVPLFTWSGNVDREVQLVVRGRTVSARDVGPTEPGAQRTRVQNPLPRQDGDITVDMQTGRGNVDVIQQPNASNNYTAIIRVRDPQSGQSRYRFTAYWEGTSAGEVVSPGGRYERRGRWTGHVDDDIQILLRGSNVQYRTLGGKRTDDAAVSFTGGALPMADAQVSVNVNSGRGSVNVVQQPSAANGYTAIIDVRDPQRGFGYYDLDIRWY